jgi:carbon storage regulator
VLVLSRNAGESIIIGHDIVVTVVETRGDQVRLGITAPRSVPIHREEVYAELVRQNRLAASVSPEQIAKLTRRRPQ